MVKIEFEISDEAYDLLIKIGEEKWIEYRDRYSDVEEFKKHSGYPDGINTVEKFLSRNHNGTQGLAWELCDHNLIDSDENSWHTTFVLTDFGKETLSKHRIRDREINKVLEN
tara:strand:- start:65864 stop:66199 length:336 start_codon:yes stop_codon:yes gene_type:complete